MAKEGIVMPVSIPVRHDSIKSTPPIRDTFDFLSLILSVGDSSNTGFNVLVTADVAKSLEEQRELKKDIIEIDNDGFQMITQDLMRINFARLRIGGVNIAGYVGDIRKVVENIAIKKEEEK